MAFLSQGTNFQKRLNIFSESMGRSARQVRGNEGSRINRHQAQGGQIRRGSMTAATLHYVNMMFTMRKVHLLPFFENKGLRSFYTIPLIIEHLRTNAVIKVIGH